MKSIEQRLRMLEAQGPRLKRSLRIVRQIIANYDGKALPWNPMHAHSRGEGEIHRREGESASAFETRALSHFTSVSIVIEGVPSFITEGEP